MRKISFYLGCMWVLAAAVSSTYGQGIPGKEKDATWYIKQAPFDMNVIADPVIPARVLNLKDFGGVGDGKVLNTGAFAKAIAACTAAGGGRVIVPAGVWLTGPIELKSNIDLHLEQGALVQFSGDHSQYPIRQTGKNKFDVTPPLWGRDVQNVAITGKGVFDGNGQTWRPLKKEKVSAAQWNDVVSAGGVLSANGKIWWPSAEAMNGDAYLTALKGKAVLSAEDYLPARDFLRPKMVVISGGKNVLIDGPTFRNSPMFIINPGQIENLIIRNSTVHNDHWAQNGDAIDISACRNVLIYNNMVNAGDDGICMKSSGSTADNDGLSNVVIAQCTVLAGHGGFVIGSNTDAGMKNIFVNNCLFDGTDIGIRVKSNSGRGGLVRDVFVSDILMRNIIKDAVQFDTWYEDVPAGKVAKGKSMLADGSGKIPEFTGFTIKNVVCEGAQRAMFFRGLKDTPVHDITFENVSIIAKDGVQGEAVKNIVFKNVNIKVANQPVIDPSIDPEIKR